MGKIKGLFGTEAKDSSNLSPAEAHLATLVLAAGGVAAGDQLPAYISRASKYVGSPAQ